MEALRLDELDEFQIKTKNTHAASRVAVASDDSNTLVA
jgi:hypothetical protein